MSWILGNGEESHAANPETFEIPEKSERTSLQVGDFAKLMFLNVEGRGERMWVTVTEVLDGTYIGTLANHPIFTHLKFEEEVAFKPEHVISIASRVK